MANTSLDSIILTLLEVLNQPANRKQAINNFQKIIWDGIHEPLQGNVREVLADLAYDFDFCESSEQCQTMVREALARLQQRGVNIPVEV